MGQRTGYSDDLVDGVNTVYRRRAVSLPRGHSARVPLLECLPAPQQYLLMDESRLLRSELELRDALSVVPLQCTMDSVLRRGGFDDGWFLWELLDKDIIEVSSHVEEPCGIFSVKKKDASLR